MGKQLELKGRFRGMLENSASPQPRETENQVPPKSELEPRKNVMIPESLHRQLKIISVHEGKSLKTLVTDILKEYANKHG